MELCCPFTSRLHTLAHMRAGARLLMSSADDAILTLGRAALLMLSDRLIKAEINIASDAIDETATG